MTIKGHDSGTGTAFPGADWQLAAGHYENFVQWTATAYASQLEADTIDSVIYPRPDSETGLNSRHRWAHDQMIYEVPVYLRAGAFTYNVEVDTLNTSAALLSYITVTNNWTNTIGEPSCFVRITTTGIQTLTKDGTTPYTIQLKGTDQDGDEIKIWWSFIVENVELDHFVFVDNSNAGTKDGKFATPYAALDDTTNGTTNMFSGTGANSDGLILVVKEGNSQTTNYTKDSDWFTDAATFWDGVTNNPADTNRPIIDLENTWRLFSLNAKGDYFIYGLISENGVNPAASAEGKGAFFNVFGKVEQDRLTIGYCKFDGMASWVGSSTTTNNGCLTVGNVAAGRNHCVISDIELANIPASNLTTNTGVALMFMGYQYVLINNWYIHDFGTGTDLVPQLMFIKHNYSELQVRNINANDNVRALQIQSNDNATETFKRVNIEFCYFNFKSTEALGAWLLQTTELPLSDGPGYVYRCTINGSQQVSNWDVPTTFKGNVSTAANNFVNDGDITVTQPNYDDADGTAITGDFDDTTNKLKDAWYTANAEVRGTIGHEIA